MPHSDARAASHVQHVSPLCLDHYVNLGLTGAIVVSYMCVNLQARRMSIGTHVLGASCEWVDRRRWGLRPRSRHGDELSQRSAWSHERLPRLLVLPLRKFLL